MNAFDHSYWMDADERHPDPGPMPVCACCGDETHPSDLADPDDWCGELAEWMNAQPGPVCAPCADAMTVCEDCGAVVPAEETSPADEGPICENCATPERIDPLGARIDNARE